MRVEIHLPEARPIGTKQGGFPGHPSSSQTQVHSSPALEACLKTVCGHLNQKQLGDAHACLPTNICVSMNSLALGAREKG